MNREREKHVKDRLIHIRLDEHTHRELKIFAARTSATVQSVVEDLIKSKVARNRFRLKEAD